MSGTAAPAAEPASPAGGWRGVADVVLHARPSESRVWRFLGLLMMAVAIAAYWQYMMISSLFMGVMDPVLIEESQKSPLFGVKADYIVAAAAKEPDKAMLPIRQASRVLMNGRLMFVWAIALERTGQVDKARFLAARLHEFNVPAAAPYFATCDKPEVKASEHKPIWCEPPHVPLTWRDFR